MGAPETSCAPNAQQSTQTTPSAATAWSDERRWPAATRVRRSTARVVRTKTRDAEHRGADDGQVRGRPADRVAHRLDPDPGVAPVADGVERPVEGREEAEVEDLHDHQQTESRPDDPGQEASSGGGQDEGQSDDDEALERDPHERAGRETTRLVGSDEGGPHEQNGEDREHRRRSALATRAAAGRRAVGCVPVASTATRRRGRTTRQAGQARRRGRLGSDASGRTSAAAIVRTIP